jgi:hypothetical protein
MREVVERVAAYKPDVAFLPVSQMTYRYRWGGVNAFCRHLDRTLLERTFQYTAGPDYAGELATACGAKHVVPYATFSFSRLETTSEDMRFGSVLRSRALAKSHYPLRPLESITPADLRGGIRSSMRRRTQFWWRALAALRLRGKRILPAPALASLRRLKRLIRDLREWR